MKFKKSPLFNNYLIFIGIFLSTLSQANEVQFPVVVSTKEPWVRSYALPRIVPFPTFIFSSEAGEIELIGTGDDADLIKVELINKSANTDIKIDLKTGDIGYHFSVERLDKAVRTESVLRITVPKKKALSMKLEAPTSRVTVRNLDHSGILVIQAESLSLENVNKTRINIKDRPAKTESNCAYKLVLGLVVSIRK